MNEIILGLLGGLALFLYGMQMMSNGLEAAAGNRMKEILEKLTANRFLGVLVGAVVTAVIQSSSASVGILQALASNGLIAFPNAVFVLFGQNIGTCITAVLASIGTSRSAKRTTIIHLMFNLIGTAIFTTACLLFPIAEFVESFTPGNPAASIANMHTTFNIVTTCLLLPFGNYLAKAATLILPDGKEKEPETVGIQNEAMFSNSLQLGFSAVHRQQLAQEIANMLEIAKESVHTCFQAVLDKDSKLLEKADKMEDTIDLMNKEIGQYISKILVHDTTGNDVTAIEEYFVITGNIERIGDHILNIGQAYAKIDMA